MFTGKPLVSLIGAKLSTPDEIASVVLSIAGEPAIRPGVLEDLLRETVAAFSANGGSPDAIGQHIFVLINQKIHSSDPAVRSECLSLLARYHDFTAKSIAAATAYSPVMKPRPTAVYWPNPEAGDHANSLYDELPYVRSYGLVDRNTPLGSAGSCFATEIARHLKSNAFNYVVTEENDQSSANWGIIFNTPSFRQLVERAFGVKPLPKLLWSRPAPNGLVYLDPFREGPVYESVEAYEADLERHIIAAREALTRAKVFVITLGMNEVWRLKADGSVLSRAPWNLAPYLIEQRIMTPEENVAELERMLAVWRCFNPGLKLIVTVSPVPLHATFRADDFHVITANAHSKAVLRVAAETFCGRNKDVYYFPSYELVSHCVKDAWEPDQRHVSAHTVARVMQLFDTMFVRQ